MKIDPRILDINSNVKQLSDKALIDQTDLVTTAHRSLTVLVLRHLREVEVRRLYVDLNYSSMHKCCIHRYKFSENETQRWLDSARLMTELPEIETQVESGSLNVTNLYKLQSFVRAEKAVDHIFTREEKLELVADIQNKPTRQVERELIQKSHQPALLAEKFHMTSQVLNGTISTALDANNFGMNTTFQKFEALLDPAAQELLCEFQNLYGNELQDMAATSILSFLLKGMVNAKKKKVGLVSKQKPNAPAPCAPKPESSRTSKDKLTPLRRPLKISTKKAVWQKAQGCCEHLDRESKIRCSSKFALQPDHIIPVALGGTNEISNLQLLCRAHNSRRSVKTFGIFQR
jgi:hypothetical protein